MRFALALLTALLFQSPKPNPHPQPPITTGGAENLNAGHTGTQDNPLVVHIKGTEQSTQEAADNKGKDDREDNRKFYELMLTGVIALAAIAQVITASVQACIYRKQSRIMKATLRAVRVQANTMDAQTKILGESVAVAKQSAETTAGSFKAMIDKERARLSLEITHYRFGHIPALNYKLTCHGTTPAYVASSWESTSVMPIPDFPWTKDAVYGGKLRDLPSVIPNGTMDGFVFILGTDRNPAEEAVIHKQLAEGTNYLHFRVRILYKDVFDDSSEHELIVNKIYGVKPEKSYMRVGQPGRSTARAQNSPNGTIPPITTEKIITTTNKTAAPLCVKVYYVKNI